MTSEVTVPAPTDHEAAEVAAFYDALARFHMIPLWTQVDDLMPNAPRPQARPHIWSWRDLYPLAKRAGDLVPVGRGGERRAIALANPGLGGLPFATPTLWAAIQYLGPHEVAPEHRHTQNAFRFVLEGEGVWTVVNGDPVAMRRGDLLLTPGWHFHGHQNVTDSPMAWLDGLDIPFVHQTDSSFFEFGPEDLSDPSTPERSKAEQLWGHAGLQPVSLLGSRPSSPLMAYRWEATDRALSEQLALETAGHPVTVEPGHAAVRYSNPTSGRDVLPTIRAEFHRLQAECTSATRREVGSSVWQVFSGAGVVTIDGIERLLQHGDVFVVPSWSSWEISATEPLDLFRFSDAPIFEAFNQFRVGTTSGAS